MMRISTLLLLLVSFLSLMAQPEQYTVRFDANGGHGIMPTIAVNADTTIVSPTCHFSRQGCYFGGWLDDDDFVILPEDEFFIDADITLRAQWLITVHYFANGGEGTMANEEQEADIRFELNECEYDRDGFLFAGWSTTADGSSGIINDSATFSQEVFLYAQWIRDTDFTLSIAYDALDGETINDDTTFIAGNLYQIPEGGAFNLGYIFDGWNSGDDGTGDYYAPGHTYLLDNDVQLYAMWRDPFEDEYDTYTITFNKGANGATGSMSSITAIEGIGIVAPYATYNLNHAHFYAWRVGNDEDADIVFPGEVFYPDENTTLYAVWANYIYYESNGANAGIMYVDEVVRQEEYYIPEGLFELDDYVFANWSSRPDGSGISYETDDLITLTEDITLYAQWSPIHIYVDYHANGGQGWINNGTYFYNDNIILSENQFYRDNYIFTGWNTAEDGSGIAYAEGDTIFSAQKDLLLFAQWEEDILSIHYHANGGTGFMPTAIISDDMDYTLDSNTFVREYYTFVGWNTKPDGSGIDYEDGETIYAIDETIHLYAQWEAQACTLTYLANGGNGTLPDDIVHPGDTIIIKNNPFIRNGYSWKEWNTAADGTGTAYDPGDTLFVIGNTTLYAIWTNETGIPSVADIQISIFPNPTTGKVTINHSEILTIEAIDLNGRVLLHNDLVNTIDLTTLSRGVYTLRIVTPEGTALKHVVRN